MEYPVIYDGRCVGSCVLEEQGLYWYLSCRCEVLSDLVERVYCGCVCLGVLEREGEALVLRRRVSRSAFPMLPPVSGILTLRPESQPQLWQGRVMGFPLKGILKDQMLLFPYDECEPCPCEPLFCFFEIEDGFWRLPYPLSGREADL